MKLTDYMRENSLTDEVMATTLGCSAGAVRKWRYGERMPRPDQMVRIRAATNGAVTADDFLPSPQEPTEPDRAEAAA